MSTEGYQGPSRFAEAERTHAFVGDAGGGCLLSGCGYSYNHVIHRVLTHNPEADEAERLRVRENFNLRDHMKAAKGQPVSGQQGSGQPVSTASASAPSSAPSSEPVTVTLEQAIIIAKHYLLFDELESRAAEAETRTAAAESRAVTAEAFAASALKDLAELQSRVKPAQETNG